MFKIETLIKVKEVSLPKILADLGIKPVHPKDPYSGAKKYIYLASYRGESHPSLSVFLKGSQWLFKDHAMGIYGTNIDLLVRFGFFGDWREAAKYIINKYLFLEEVSCPEPRTSLTSSQKGKIHSSTGVIQSVSSLVGSPAEEYVTSIRCIPLPIAARYLSYVTYANPTNGKSLYGIGWPNLAGGWAIRWPKELGPGKGKFFVGPAGITHAPSMLVPISTADTCAVFEGIFDFLSFIAIEGGLLTVDAIIMNSVSHVMKAVDLLAKRNYSVICCYLDNDEHGHRATETIISNLGSRAKDCSEIYQPHKDFNDYLKSIKNTK